MEYFVKKITYLKGLCDGSGFTPDTKEGKLFYGILEVLDDMAFMLESYMEDEELFEPDEEPVYSYAFLCPQCHEEICVDQETMENNAAIVCGACGETVAIGTADIDELP